MNAKLSVPMTKTKVLLEVLSDGNTIHLITCKHSTLAKAFENILGATPRPKLSVRIGRVVASGKLYLAIEPQNPDAG